MKLTVLTLDCGNTSVSAGLFRNDKLLRTLSAPRRKPEKLLQLIDKQELSGFIVSAVAPVPTALLRRLAGIPSIRIGKKTELPFRNTYRTPRTLGQDRVACIAGASRLFPGETVLVIDAGTCIKYDLLDAGIYRGGSITPGLQMRFDALHHYTHALPQLTAGKAVGLTGRDTKGSILSGVQEGILFEMKGFINSYQQQYKRLKIVVTGGDAARLAKPLKSNIFAAPHLIHLGLYEIFRKNSG